MAKGSSGGPWIGYDHTIRKYGYIIGLNSFLQYDSPNFMFSPILGGAFKEIYNCLVGEKDCSPINR
jgi:hypothetical protein